MKEVTVKAEIKFSVNDTKTLGDIENIADSIEENLKYFMGLCPVQKSSVKTTWDYNLKE